MQSGVCCCDMNEAFLALTALSKDAIQSVTVCSQTAWGDAPVRLVAAMVKNVKTWRSESRNSRRRVTRGVYRYRRQWKRIRRSRTRLRRGKVVWLELYLSRNWGSFKPLVPAQLPCLLTI